MSIHGDDREAGADASSTPPDIVPASETEDKAPATTTKLTLPDKNSPSPQIIPQSPAEQYAPAATYPNYNNINNNNNHQSSVFMRQPNGCYAYQQSNTPNSPAPNTLGYEPSQALLFQHLGTNALTGIQQQFHVAPQPPLSPGMQNAANDTGGAVGGPDDAQISLGVLAPSSPVYPAPSMTFMGTGSEHQQHVDSSRMTGGSLIAPPSPSIHFLPGHPQSPVVSGYGGVYSSYVAQSPGVGVGVGVGYGSPSPREMGTSTDSRLSWPDRVQQQQSIYQTAPPSANSPHVQSQPMSMQFQTDRRTASFDEMLPGPSIDDNGSITGAGTIFSQQQAPWGYNPNNPYTNSPQQPQIQGHLPQPGDPRALAGQHGRSLQGALGTAGYYPATTPGPPIQTTHHNKGPEGSNLFIFHIPNHFTNLDMWHLFCHYGNLLSVRIMVEKDSGRSRGFGFVSYDSPDAAAMAIKELNGFVVRGYTIFVFIVYDYLWQHLCHLSYSYRSSLPSIFLFLYLFFTRSRLETSV